jgi:hypothetical protein
MIILCIALRNPCKEALSFNTQLGRVHEWVTVNLYPASIFHPTFCEYLMTGRCG